MYNVFPDQTPVLRPETFPFSSTPPLPPRYRRLFQRYRYPTTSVVKSWEVITGPPGRISPTRSFWDILVRKGNDTTTGIGLEWKRVPISRPGPYSRSVGLKRVPLTDLKETHPDSWRSFVVRPDHTRSRGSRRRPDQEEDSILPPVPT